MGVSHLLDTHAFLWLVFEGRKRRPEVIAELQASEAVYVSPVSAFEVTSKHRLGKLPEAAELGDWAGAVRRLGATELPLAAEPAEAAGQLEWEHRDPFDRLLVAQARHDHLVMVTADEVILDSGLVRTLPW